MINYFIHDEHGHIFRSGTNTAECIEMILASEGGTVRYHHEALVIGDYYWDGGLIPYPPAPDLWSVFDHAKKQWVPNLEAATASARTERARLLAESDWTQMPDAPVDKKAWKAYRQALRDLTSTPGFPYEINWPVAPK